MKTRCERQGQVELGIVEHEGREFAALGASVVGRQVTGYTKLIRGELRLTTWCGRTMLECRSKVVERYWDGSLAVMFRLANGRYILGYALSESGMLFRGELVDNCTDDDARRHAAYLSQFFGDIDAEEEAIEAEVAEA